MDHQTRDAATTRCIGNKRTHPHHCDQLPDSHKINQLFFWFLEEGGELGVLRNVDKALRFAELARACRNRACTLNAARGFSNH